ncbi:hypothetical protein HMPREF0541_01950 [Lacticaseibacillus rhamnosus ATCC 21052]|nr:hypothetical protein HMPREF0541_01950 [Lacticaseibacillus rhamnosus ATCC 21052]
MNTVFVIIGTDHFAIVCPITCDCTINRAMIAYCFFLESALK